MFLRRIVESFVVRNWSVVITELFVVIVGVFIGIQVSNWNDARIDKTRARSYLERIRADLDADIVNYRNRLQFWDAVSGYGAQALGYSETGSLGDRTEWDLLLAFFQASQLADFYTTSVTYDELKGAGELGLIEDLELRNLLAYYYTNADDPTLTERPAYREHVRGLVPLHIQSYIWSNCFRSNEFNIQVMIECKAPVDATDAAKVITAISSDKQLMSELRYWMSSMHVASIIGRDRIIFATDLRASIDAASIGVSANEKP